MTDQLALHGGTPAKESPYTLTNRYGEEEIVELRKALESGKLMGPAGIVEDFEAELAEFFGVKHMVTVTSGTAALHTALCALGVAEGDEVITTPMTDIGTVAAILALHAVPIFADIDLETRLIDPESVRSKITNRTKCIITVHMSGMPCDMDAFMALGAETGVKILEDCAQAHGGIYKERLVGSIGDASGFSMNESKQMTTGDGGFVGTDDDETGRIASLFRDKTCIRDGSVGRGGQPIPFFALNYRANGLHAAVGRAQLTKLPALVARRREIANRYYEELGDLEGLSLPRIVDGGYPSWWPIAARYTGTKTTRDDLVEALRAEGLTISTGMSPANNILRTDLVRTKRYYPLTEEVPAFWRDVEYDPDSCPNVDALQESVVRLPVDERYIDEDVDETIAGVRKVWSALVD
ncbi:MAG: DegT/DnrJ/EryC1/StrS family aminotransferase [Gemmatimonadetes bacterium]|nr:DegT/DnrJ/EryC1/StrS family aminotransferase [Gemmatimonadota bacterium]